MTIFFIFFTFKNCSGHRKCQITPRIIIYNSYFLYLCEAGFLWCSNTCALSLLIVQKLLYIPKNITLPQVIQLSIQISMHGIYFPGVLDYITIFKNILHVFCFCKVVVQVQKHIQGYLVLTENIYPGRSKIGC